MKVFISQPMAARSEENIRAERQRIMEYAGKLFPGEELEEINSYFNADIQSKNTPLRLLGMSIELLAEADVAIFAECWMASRGCIIEHECAKNYGVRIVDLD